MCERERENPCSHPQQSEKVGLCSSSRVGTYTSLASISLSELSIEICRPLLLRSTCHGDFRVLCWLGIFSRSSCTLGVPRIYPRSIGVRCLLKRTDIGGYCHGEARAWCFFPLIGPFSVVQRLRLEGLHPAMVFCFHRLCNGDECHHPCDRQTTGLLRIQYGRVQKLCSLVWAATKLNMPGCLLLWI